MTGMVLAAAALVVLTLPFCGLGGWMEWLGVATQTEHLYQTLPRWTSLSRDIPGLLRRIDQRTSSELAGWAALAAILAVTTYTYRSAHRSGALPVSGPRAVVLFSGALLTCPRFMFYDMTLAVLPVLAGLAAWPRLGRGSRGVLVLAAALLWAGTWACYLRWQMLGPPFDTFAVLLIWGWAVVETQRTRFTKAVENQRANRVAAEPAPAMLAP
jgi:hypothetical protein